MGSLFSRRKSPRVRPSIATSEQTCSKETEIHLSTEQHDTIASTEDFYIWERKCTHCGKSEQLRRRRSSLTLSPKSMAYAANPQTDVCDENGCEHVIEVNECNIISGPQMHDECFEMEAECCEMEAECCEIDEEIEDKVSMVSSGQQLTVTGVKGPLAHIINGIYMCKEGLDDPSKHHTDTIYQRCLNTRAGGDYQIIIQYDKERWVVLHTRGGDSEPFLLAYCAELKLPDPSESSHWFIRQ